MKLLLSYLLLLVDFTHGMKTCKDTLDCLSTQICGKYTQKWHQSPDIIYEQICIDKGDCGVYDNLKEYTIKMECFPLSFMEMMLIKLILEFILVIVICLYVKRNSKNTDKHIGEKQTELANKSAINILQKGEDMI